MKRKGTRKRREGGSLNFSLKKKSKRQSKQHTKRIAKLFEKGELTSGQSVPHEVLRSFDVEGYVPSEADEGYIPWNSLPHEVVAELHENIPSIKNIIKSNVIKPDGDIMNKHERNILREKSLVSNPHKVKILKGHYTVPNCVPYGPMPTLGYSDMATKKNPMIRMIDSFGFYNKGNSDYDDPLQMLLPHQKEILTGTTVYSDISAFFSRIKMRSITNKKCSLDDFVRNIENCVGVNRTGDPKPDFEGNNPSPEELKKPSPEYKKYKTFKSKPFRVATTLKLDTNGRYYVTFSVPCETRLTVYVHSVEKDFFVGVFDPPKTFGTDIEYAFHACNCK